MKLDILALLMVSSYHTLAALAADLHRRLASRSITASFTQTKDELVLSFDGIADCLVVSCAPVLNALYLHHSFARARRNSTDVLGVLPGTIVQSVSIHPSDRILTFTLSGIYYLHAAFFGSKANIIVTDGHGTVIDAFKRSHALRGTSYHAPRPATPPAPAALRLQIGIAETAGIAAVLKKAYPTLGSILVDEVLTRTGLATDAIAESLTAEQIGKVDASVGALLSEFATPRPRVYLSPEPDCIPRFSLVTLRQFHSLEERFFGSIHEAIRFTVARRWNARVLSAEFRDLTAKLTHHRQKLERALQAVRNDLDRSSREQDYERYGTLLMAHLHLLEKGLHSVTLPRDGAGTSIELDPSLSPLQNAQRYFRKAKRARAAREESMARLAALRSRSALLEELLEQSRHLPSRVALHEFIAAHAPDLRLFGVESGAKKEERLPFRIFTVDGGFAVWAGKSSANNDLLTMKHARPDDFWFHARGGSGSHVLLKTRSAPGTPTKKAKQQAASIAAYYSSLKNASAVPVVVTERKYVRKPKGAPPGTVVVEREDIIFAEPGLPEAP